MLLRGLLLVAAFTGALAAVSPCTGNHTSAAARTTVSTCGVADCLVCLTPAACAVCGNHKYLSISGECVDQCDIGFAPSGLRVEGRRCVPANAPGVHTRSVTDAFAASSRKLERARRVTGCVAFAYWRFWTSECARVSAAESVFALASCH
jgi:hypothetical protein